VRRELLGKASGQEGESEGEVDRTGLLHVGMLQSVLLLLPVYSPSVSLATHSLLFS
jgi:hypothetical protein